VGDKDQLEKWVGSKDNARQYRASGLEQIVRNDVQVF